MSRMHMVVLVAVLATLVARCTAAPYKYKSASVAEAVKQLQSIDKLINDKDARIVELNRLYAVEQERSARAEAQLGNEHKLKAENAELSMKLAGEEARRNELEKAAVAEARAFGILHGAVGGLFGGIFILTGCILLFRRK